MKPEGTYAHALLRKRRACNRKNKPMTPQGTYAHAIGDQRKGKSEASRYLRSRPTIAPYHVKAIEHHRKKKRVKPQGIYADAVPRKCLEFMEQAERD